ncbi:hypothetical protein EXIGLDRAFT_717734 [Exidia glandulosa HHB12029]|uniref:Uncharacterized protein n=1 Tax=Exidia glandulosa HHB12029 TaxID=1314781 RepID=A0A165I6M5_EXIGL|nr:hypothetical protein EXIGLDRAFT_717734 [Exidia glandulosa HHB12029]
MWFQPGGVPGRKAAAANAFRKKKGGKGKGGKGNAGAGAGAGNAGAANATTTTSAAAETTTAADNVAAADTGIKDVVEMCLNADGKTGCFEILGDSKDSCFTIPRPIGNNVAFFLPPPDDTCELFTDLDCTSNPTPAFEAISDIKQLSWSCLPTANATATTTTTDTATTTTAANNAIETGKDSNVNDATDTGIKDVIEGCNNADGFTKCFEILGDSQESCFTIPRPLANNVAFWLPPPNSTCTLFTDEDCSQNAFTPALGAIPNVKQNSWSCVANAA